MTEQRGHILLNHSLHSFEEKPKRAKGSGQKPSEQKTASEFSPDALLEGLRDESILTADTALSGAQKQLWTCCVLTSSELKAKIRKADEVEELENYHGNIGDRLLNDLKRSGRDHIKGFLVQASASINLFKCLFELDSAGNRKNNHYFMQSVGNVMGLLSDENQYVGSVVVTQVSSQTSFLARVLVRPSNERAFRFNPVGHFKERVKNRTSNGRS